MSKALLAAMAFAALVGQLANELPKFEVAAIKRNASLDGGGTLAMLPGGRFRAVNFDARTLVAFAYRTGQRNLFPSQIIGAPDWLTSERYDIIAKIGAELVARGTTDPLQTPKLVQSLLEDRFRLRTHRETRELPVYALVLARKGGALGPQFRRSTTDCAVERAKCRIQTTLGHLSAGAMPMVNLAGFLSATVERLVVDRTGLEGPFDVEIEWSPDQLASEKPSIFAAVQEQLGLKLESTRGPVDVLVIDYVERPTED